jgi:phosphopantothenoylcysteine decarboxylase / phosphopantothenate---cysteine ligase
MALEQKRVLLVIGGGIAAYKSLDLIRRLRERGAAVRVVMTRAAQEFITPLAVGALAGGRAFTDLFDPQANSTSGTSGSRATRISSSSRRRPPI